MANIELSGDTTFDDVLVRQGMDPSLITPDDVMLEQVTYGPDAITEWFAVPKQIVVHNPLRDGEKENATLRPNGAVVGNGVFTGGPRSYSEIGPRAMVLGFSEIGESEVGAGTIITRSRIGKVVVGKDCVIDRALVGKYDFRVEIGNNVRIGQATQILGYSRIGDNALIGSNVSITGSTVGDGAIVCSGNERTSVQDPEEYTSILLSEVADNVIVGKRATIDCSEVGSRALVGHDAIVRSMNVGVGQAVPARLNNPLQALAHATS